MNFVYILSTNYVLSLPFFQILPSRLLPFCASVIARFFVRCKFVFRSVAHLCHTRVGTHEAVLSISDEILSMARDQRLSYQRRVCGLRILQKRSLKLLLVIIGYTIYFFIGKRIDSGIKHNRRRSTGRGIEVLNLLGRISPLLQIQRELERVLKTASRVARHKIRNEVLLLTEAFCEFEISLLESIIHGDRRLAHIAEDVITAMLGSDLKLTADVIFHELLEEGLVLIAHHIVEAYSRTNKHLFDLRERRHTTKKLDVFGVIDLEVFTRRRCKALAVCADAVLQLMIAGGIAKIRRRTADVVDIALETRALGYLLRLGDHRFYTAASHASSLMESECAEVTAAEAASVMSHRHFDLGNARNAAVLFV